MSGDPTAILFDAGGTLVLQDPVRLSDRLGFAIDPGVAFDAHYRTMAEFSARKIEGDPVNWDWWLEAYYTRLGHPEPAAAGPSTDGGYGFWCHPLPGVVEAVGKLTEGGVRTAVVSNSDGSVEASLAEAGFSGRFEFVLDSAIVGVSKPDPGIFLAACDRMGVAPTDVWYVGDSIYHDIAGAEAAGLAAGWLVDPLGLHPAVGRRVASVVELVRYGGALA